MAAAVHNPSNMIEEASAHLNNDYSLIHTSDIGKDIAQVIDNIDKNFNFLQKVKAASISPSAETLLDIQKRVVNFSVTTQIVSKIASVGVKNIDTLTRLQ